MKSALLKLSLAAALVFGLALPVLAHGVIEKADPPVGGAVSAAPAAVKLWFSEPVDPALSRITVTAGEAGSRVDLGDPHIDADGALTVTLKPGLGQGVYFVQWQVFTPGDGHESGGAYSFGVGTAATSAATVDNERTPLGDLARFLTLAGQCLFLGLVVFRWLIRLDDETAFRRSLYWPAQLVRVSLGLGLLAALYAQTASLGVPVWTVLGTVWGAAWLARAAAAAVVIARTSELLRGSSLRAGLLAGAFLILAVALTSHSAAQFGLPGALMDLLHQASASVWVGGVLGTALALRSGERSFLLPFGALAVAAVGGLVVSGLWLAGAQVAAWTSLLFTPYGRVLLAKLAVAAAAFVLGGINALSQSRLRWLPLVEAAVGLLVIGFAAMLADLPPAATQVTDNAPDSLSLKTSDGDWTYKLEVSPARVGQNLAKVLITRQDGWPAYARQVHLHFVPLDGPGNGIVESDLDLARVAEGYFSGSGVNLTGPGRWQVLLSADDARFANFELAAGPDGALRPADARPGMAVALVDWLNRYALLAGLAAMLFMAAGWAGLAWRMLRQTAEPGVRLAIWLAPGLLLAGVLWLSIKLLS